MSENPAKRKKVKIRPTVGSLSEQTVEIPANMSVAEAIGRVFPRIKNKRVVIQNNKDEPIPQDTKVSDVDEVRVTPFTEGG